MQKDAIRAIQIKTTMSYHYTTIRMAKIKIIHIHIEREGEREKRGTPPNAGENAEKLNRSYIAAGGNAK